MTDAAPEQISIQLLEQTMQRCLDEAHVALNEGNVPIASALLDPSGVVVLIDHNREKFPVDNRLRHAEMNVLEQSVHKDVASGSGRDRLRGYSILSTAEPCSGCASFSIKNGIRAFYFGAYAESSMDPEINMRAIEAASKESLIVVGGIREEECKDVLALGRNRETK